jgi:hypothetical protein
VTAACETAIRITGRVSPGPETAVYEQVYLHYRSLYPALKAAFKQDAQVVAKIR